MLPRHAHTFPSLRPLARFLASLVLALAASFAATSPALAAGTPNVSLAITQQATVLWGAQSSVTFQATSPSSPATQGYNLSYRAVLPAGVTYVPGSAGSAAGEPSVITSQPSAGKTTLLWKNLADLAPGTSHVLTFKVSHSTQSFAPDTPSNTFSVIGGAYIQANADLVPGFTAAGAPDTSGGGTFTGSSEITTAAAANTTKITAIQVTETTDTPADGQMLRGLHANQSIHTVTVTNNGVSPVTTPAIEEYLPLGLEFLGCGGAADNTANAPTNPGNAEEYPGAGAISVTSAGNGSCIAPASVDTLAIDPPGPGPSATYTYVKWNLAGLAAGQSRTITFATAIPLRANTTTWPGGTPAAGTGKQGANLNNNSGPEIADGTVLTDYATAYAFAGGLTRADTSTTRTAEDLAVRAKAQSPGLSPGGTTNWDITLTTSEYRDASGAYITDSLPDGLCPLDNGVQHANSPTAEDDSECLSSGPSPTVPYTSADEHADGTWSLTWDLSATPSLAQLAPNTTHTITFPTATRGSYQDNYDDVRPVTAGDTVTNTANASATGRLACASGAACPPGPAPGNQIGNGLTFASAVAGSGSDTLTARSAALTAGIAATSSNCSAASYGHSVPNYRPGDRVCFQLRSDYPSSASTQQGALGAFLPRALTWDAGFMGTGDQTTANDSIGGGVTLDSSTANPGPGGTLRWALPSTYVGGGNTFEHRVAATVGLPTGAQPGDTTATIFKSSTPNNAGAAVTARDEVDYALSLPQLSIQKQITKLNSTPVTPTQAQTVRGGDVVTFRVELANASTDTDAKNIEAWDPLPTGVTCAAVTASAIAISDNGVCDNDIIKWGSASPATAPQVAAGAPPVDLTYAIVVPTTIQPTQAFTSSAGVRQFQSASNTSGLFTYWPSSNVDPTAESSANLAPILSSATLTGQDLSTTETGTTSITESGNGASAATIGETLHYTVNATIPAGETVRDLTITTPVEARQTLQTGTVTQTAGPAATQSIASGTITWSLGSSYAAPTGSDTVLTFTFDTIVADVAANYRSALVLNNQSTLTYSPPGLSSPNAGSTQVTAPVNTALVEPLITADLPTASPSGPVTAGQTLDITVAVRNGSSAVSPGHETQLVDTITTGMTPLNAAGNPIANGEYTLGGSATGGLWNSAARTLTFVVPATLDPGIVDSHTFKATIDSPAVGGTPIKNTVVATTTSLAGSDPNERTAVSANHAGYTDTKSLSVSPAGATVSTTQLPTTVPVTPAATPSAVSLTPAQQNLYTLTVTLPANTKLYDVYAAATLPDTLVFDSFTSPPNPVAQCTSGCGAGTTPQINAYNVVSGNTPNTQIVAWDLGDLINTTGNVRTVQLPFFAHLLATKRGSGSPGTAITDPGTGQITSNVSTDRTDRRPFFTASGTPQSTFTFDDTSAASIAAFSVVEPGLTLKKQVAVNSGSYVDAPTTGPVIVHDGDLIHYRVTVTNNGHQPAYDIVLQDNPDTRMTNVTMAPGISTTTNLTTNGGHPWQSTSPNQYMAWSLGTGGLDPGASTTVEYSATMPPVATLHDATTFLNTATVHDAYGMPQSYRAGHGGSGYVYRDYNSTNYPSITGKATVKYERPTISINKTTGISPSFPKTGPAQVDHPFTWRVVVTNTSLTAPTTELEVTDTLPKDWTYDVGSGSFTGTGGGAIDPTVTPNAAGDGLDFKTHIALAAGASTTLTYTARPTLASITSIGSGPTHPHTNTASANVLDAAGVASDLDGPFVAGPSTASATIDLPSLHIVASPKGGTAKAGDVVPFHIVVSNTGPVEATNLIVTDTLPTGTTFTSGTATSSTTPTPVPATTFSQLTATSTTASWKLSALAAGASVDITVPINSDPASPSGTVLTNGASVNSAQTTSITDSGTVTLTPSADLQATKTAPAAVNAGASLQYVIGAKNLGPSVATAIVLKDQLPSTVTYVGVTSAGTCTHGPTTPATSPATVTVTCTFSGATAVNGTVSATIDTTVGANVTTDANNTSTATSSTTDPASANNSASVAVDVGELADLSLTASIAGAAPDPHAGHVVNTQTKALTFAIHNAGPSDSTSDSITTTLPAGLVYVSGPGTCSASGQVVTCTVASLPAGSNDSRTITVRGTAVGPRSVTATVASAVTAEPTPADNSDTAVLTVDPATDLEAAISAPATVGAGAPLTYTLTGTNHGPNDATASSITVVLPAGTTYDHADAGCTATGQSVTCPLGPLTSGASATAHVTTNVPIALGATAITANASITGPEADLVSGNNVASASTQVGPVADIQLTQSGPDSVTAGGTYTFTLTVRNNGPSDAPDVDVTDQLPDGADLSTLRSLRGRIGTGRAATPSQGSCDAPVGRAMACHLGTLPSGASTLVTVTVDVPLSLGGSTITNSASAKSSIPDPTPNNEAASFATRVLVPPPAPVVTPAPPVVVPPTSANLSITKTADGVARAQRELRYTITAKNQGPADADNVTIDDALVAGVQYRAYTTTDGRCSFSNGSIHCKLGSMKVGDLTTIHVTVVPSTTGMLVNNAVIESSTSDPFQADNRAVAKNTVSPLPPTTLAVKLKTKAKKVKGGQRVTYSLKVTNMGKNAASNMQVCDRLPAQLSFTSTKGGALNGSRLCFSQAALAAGKTATFTTHVRVAARARKGFLTNRAFADAENAALQNASMRSKVTTDGKVNSSAVQGFTG